MACLGPLLGSRLSISLQPGTHCTALPGVAPGERGLAHTLEHNRVQSGAPHIPSGAWAHSPVHQCHQSNYSSEEQSWGQVMAALQGGSRESHTHTHTPAGKRGVMQAETDAAGRARWRSGLPGAVSTCACTCRCRPCSWDMCVSRP